MQLLRYDEFKTELLNGIKTNVPDAYKGYSVEMYRIKKLNQCLDGICMLDKSAEKAVSPVIYADEIYSEYIKSGNIGDTIKLAVDMLINHIANTKSIDLENFEGNTVAVLLNYEQNKEMLKTMLHVPYKEFAIVFRWVMKCDENGVLGCLVTNEMAKVLNLDVDSLYMKSLENMKRLLPMTLTPLTDMLKLPLNDSMPVYVLSNKYGVEGGSYFLQYEIMRDIQKKLNSPFYILLPCIHEALIIPKDFCTESELKKIILKIREDNPNKSELLSDKVYLFDKAVKEVK